MPSGYIGHYKYYTLDDLENIFYSARNCDTDEEGWYYIKKHMIDMVNLIEEYVIKLKDNYWRYEDDGR